MFKKYEKMARADDVAEEKKKQKLEEEMKKLQDAKKKEQEDKQKQAASAVPSAAVQSPAPVNMEVNDPQPDDQQLAGNCLQEAIKQSK